MESLPGQEIQTVAGAERPETPAGDGGAVARDKVQPLLRPGGGGHRHHDGDHLAHQGDKGRG